MITIEMSTFVSMYLDVYFDGRSLPFLFPLLLAISSYPRILRTTPSFCNSMKNGRWRLRQSVLAMGIAATMAPGRTATRLLSLTRPLASMSVEHVGSRIRAYQREHPYGRGLFRRVSRSVTDMHSGNSSINDQLQRKSIVKISPAAMKSSQVMALLVQRRPRRILAILWLEGLAGVGIAPLRNTGAVIAGSRQRLHRHSALAAGSPECSARQNPGDQEEEQEQEQGDGRWRA